MMYAPIAIELAQQRTRELEQRARANRWKHDLEVSMLAALAGRLAPYGDPGDPGPKRPSRARRLIAGPVRALSDASHALSEVACTAATRIEGDTVR